jgi:ABC-type uncharacterized transport system permease subunit
MLKMSVRSSMKPEMKVFVRLAGLVSALVTTGIFLLALGYNPFAVYASMVEGSLGSLYNFKETIIRAIPLVVVSLGISLAFRMKFWNIGAEGQMIMGAFGGAFVAFTFSNLPIFLLLPLMAIASLITGGLWAFIAAFLKVRLNVNETIITLMLNYVALKWITYLQYGPWKDPKALGFPKIPNFTDNAVLPRVLGIHIGWIIALVLVVAMHYLIRHTAYGYEINVVGESQNTARYAGMQVGNIMLATVFFSGALCGLAGMIQSSGVSTSLNVEITGGAGYTAIITTWLSALNAPVILFVSFFFAMLIQGGDYIQTVFGIPDAAAQILQGIILFFILGSEFFVQYRVRSHVPVKNKEVT